IRLTVGRTLFPADGTTEVAIGVRDVGDTETEITLIINGVTRTVRQHQDLLLTSSTPGDFIVRVSDPYHYALPSEMIIQAVAPESNRDPTSYPHTLRERQSE